MPLGAFKAALMGTAGVSAGADVVLLSTQTASDSSSLDFTSGIDSTYGEYIFKFYNINPDTDNAWFQFNLSIDAGSNYNVTKTSTYFYAYHTEADATAFAYSDGGDLAQGTAVQPVMIGMGNGGDENGAGELHLFNPASTTYVKHYIGTFNYLYYQDWSVNSRQGGYANTTDNVDAIQFSMSSGNFDGTIKMWGVK